jgi:predicted neutral ceramidase superfamily lipid hydrolase
MAVENLDASTIIQFLIVLLVSTVVIYVATLFLRQKRSVKLALFSAIIGSIVYVIAYTRSEDPLISAILGGIAWLLALRIIYRMGWLKALIVAVIIWIIIYLIDGLLPTTIGPL